VNAVRVPVRLDGAAVAFVALDDGPEIRVRWHCRRGWFCDADGRSRTTRCEHVAAAVHALSAHVMTRYRPSTTTERETTA